ncbi:MAG: EF-hand domain-containing protein [Luteimonas sp.]
MKSLPLHHRRPGISVRRRLLFALLALLAAYAAFAWQAGLAFTAGAPTKDMDWNDDGIVSSREILQAWYAVSVRTTTDGPRTCRAYHWRGREGGDPIRVACVTTRVKSAGQ